MKIVKQTTYSLGALTVNDLIAHLEIIREAAGDSEIINVESEYEWDEDRRTGERRNTYGAVYVTVQEKA